MLRVGRANTGEKTHGTGSKKGQNSGCERRLRWAESREDGGRCREDGGQMLGGLGQLEPG